MSAVMKAISVRQPWAWFIVNGFKDIENRDWKDWNPGLKFRGPVLIHASSWWNADEITDDVDMCIHIMNTAGIPLGDKQLTLGILKRESGGIVGQAAIVDAVREHSSPWFFGRYGLVLADQKPLPFRPLKGALGFFNVPAQTEGSE